ncbi:TnsA endonuclease N-terminal domain-containing protein [Citrifermentans bremense]|uniref:TnsA endonuclease N-terminal domain-containing protein n=1 Tax=Citrifermentans bremense TaxID=60035 RepID=UPI00047C6AAB|nr:TnsA endonuclease N-terminal domain-containing protein [Citrifermentans bremense]
MPVRRIPKTFRSISGRFPSIINGRCIGYESKLERDYYLRLEFDKSIASYEEQPIRLAGVVAGKSVSYTPDCLIKFLDPGKAHRLVEVKFQSELIEKAAELEPRFSLARAYACDHSLEFVIATDKDIYDGILDNYRLIYRFGKVPRYFDTKRRFIVQALKVHGPLPLKDLLHLLASDRISQSCFMPSIYHLLFLGKIVANLDKPIDYNTILRRPNG